MIADVCVLSYLFALPDCIAFTQTSLTSTHFHNYLAIHFQLHFQLHWFFLLAVFFRMWIFGDLLNRRSAIQQTANL